MNGEFEEFDDSRARGVGSLEQQKLTASDGGGSDKFGSAVAKSGENIVVNAFVVRLLSLSLN